MKTTQPIVYENFSESFKSLFNQYAIYILLLSIFIIAVYFIYTHFLIGLIT